MEGSDHFPEIVPGRITEIPVPGAILLFDEFINIVMILFRQFVKTGIGVFFNHMGFDQSGKLKDIHRFFKMFDDIGHTASHRFHRLVGEFGRIRLQRGDEMVHFCGEQKGAVVQDAVLPDMLGIPGEFKPVDREVVPALEACFDAQFGQHLEDGFGETPEIDQMALAAGTDKGKIQVSQVMKDRSATGNASHYLNIMLLDKIDVDLGKGVLVLAYNNRGAVLPEHENVILKLLQDVLFRCEIEMRIGMVPSDDKHWKPFGKGTAFPFF
jgi:hypothetical protein